MIKGIVIGAIGVYLLEAIFVGTKAEDYFFLPVEWCIIGAEAIISWVKSFQYIKVFPLLLKHGINPFWCKMKVINERLTPEEKQKFLNCLKNDEERQRIAEYFEM